MFSQSLHLLQTKQSIIRFYYILIEPTNFQKLHVYYRQ